MRGRYFDFDEGEHILEDEETFMVFENCENSLGTRLNTLRETGELCDIVIKVEGLSIEAHKVVLSAGSNVFHAMICGGFKESQQQEIELKHEFLTGRAVSRVVEYLYTGVFQISKDIELDHVKDILQGENLLNISSFAISCFLY